MTTKPPKHFTSDEFREMGHSTIDWIADYIEHLEERPVAPDVKPCLLYTSPSPRDS